MADQPMIPMASSGDHEGPEADEPRLETTFLDSWQAS